MESLASILFADVRPRERPRFRFFLLLSGVIGMAQVVGIAASEALFLSRFPIDRLPAVFVAASLATVLFSGLYATVVGRARNDWLLERMLVIAAAALVVCGVGVVRGWTWAIPLLVCLYWVDYAVFLNHYWTFVGDYFDTVTAKRLFPLFTVGSSLGSIVGGAITVATGQLAPTWVLVFVWAGVLIAGGLLVRSHRRRLRRWGPLELAEADDTSVAGIQGALRVVRNTGLGRMAALSALAMVLSLFVLQYLYSDIFQDEFPSAGGLAVFFGAYLFVTNAVEVAVELRVTPWLIHRFGVATANVVHPVLTLLCFVGLAFDYRLHVAVLARANRELLENAMAGPVRNLVYNALPASVRGPTRAFLEGIVVYSGMAAAGATLLVLTGRLDPTWLCAVGGGTALLYLGANLGVRRRYLQTLVDELREGRLDLESVSDEMSDWEVSRLAELWRDMLTGRDERAATFAGQLAGPLAARGAIEPLRAGLDHEEANVREACVTALGTSRSPGAEDAVLLALDDESPAVRLAAVNALAHDAPSHRRETTLLRRLEDPDPRVRAAAAARLGATGLATLSTMLGAEHPETACAALRFAPATLIDAVAARVERPHATVQAAALAALVRLADPVPVGRDALVKLATHPSIDVRRNAVAALATRPEDGVAVDIAVLLEDAAGIVREAAAAALAELGEEGASAAHPYLQSERTRTVEAAIDALARSDVPEAAEWLDAELGERVRSEWRSLVALQLLPASDTLPGRFLRAAIANALARDWGLAFYLLERTEDPQVMRSVEKVLRFASARSRGDALEVLSNLGDRETAQLLVWIAEAGPIEDKIPAVAEKIELPRDAQEALDACRRSSERWLRMAFEIEDAAPERRAALEETMERLLALKQVPLFAHFNLEQLEALSHVTRERVHVEGDTIVREGDAGGELYVVLSGAVRVSRGEGTPHRIELGSMEAGDYFGEMAVFDDQPRSATVTVTRNARILVLAGERLKELVMQTPEIAFQIFEVMTSRIRNIQHRLDAATNPAQGGVQEGGNSPRVSG